MKKLGVIVNPIAGLGGRVGLKGTDSPEIVEEARRLGAVPEAPKRAADTLRRIASALNGGIDVLAPPHEMGEDEAKEAGFTPTVVGSVTRGSTMARDTEEVARQMADLPIDLLLFAGGDGTARNIYHAIGDRLPVVGIPAGVKIHSGVYTTTPRAAAELVVRYLRDEPLTLREIEVMDIDEEAFRQGAVSAKLYGYLTVPYESALVQGVKSGSSGGDPASFDGIAFDFVERMHDDWLYVVGPGTTTRAVARALGLEKTLLGVDLIRGHKLVGVDVTESQVLQAIQGQTARIVVTPIGGQGHIFGRGNQQISPKVIRQIGRENITLVATPEKLASFRGAPLLIDTGDAEVDTMLSGYFRVVTGYRKEAVYRASA
jgi:predicted polyphosphate/ATP-dependent NAD kinase